MAEEEPGGTELLKSTKDKFLCRTVKTKEIKHGVDGEFEERLRISLEHWKEENTRGVWIKIALEHSSLIQICAKYGFDFHHARPGYVMMNKWLPESQPNNLPAFANQYLGKIATLPLDLRQTSTGGLKWNTDGVKTAGAAGFVVNKKGQVLVIIEKFRESLRSWKLPGGHADIGEEVGDAAVRETFEETGIKCRFLSVLTFRHMHGYRHGLSDFYFICLLEPLSEEIHACQQEIAECQWMDLDEWLQDKNTADVSKFAINAYKDYKQHHMTLGCHKVLSVKGDRHHLMYKPTPDPSAPFNKL